MAENYSSKLNELKKKISSLEKLARKQKSDQDKKHQAHKKSVKGDIDKHKKEMKKHRDDINNYKKKITDLNKKIKKLEQKKTRAQLKPTTTFKGQMGRLSKNVETLLDVLEKADKEIGEGKLQADKDVVEKLDTLLNQNEKIAQGILAVAAMLRGDQPEAEPESQGSPAGPGTDMFPGVAPYQQAAENPADYVNNHDMTDAGNDPLQMSQNDPLADIEPTDAQPPIDNPVDFGQPTPQAAQPDMMQTMNQPDMMQPNQPDMMQPNQPDMMQPNQPDMMQLNQPDAGQRPPAPTQQLNTDTMQQAQPNLTQAQPEPMQQPMPIQPDPLSAQPGQLPPMEPPQMEPAPMQPPPLPPEFSQTNFQSNDQQLPGIEQAQPPPPAFGQQDIFSAPVERPPSDNMFSRPTEDQINPLQPASMSAEAPPGVMPFDAPPPPPDSDLAPLGPPPSPTDVQPIQQNTAPAPPNKAQLRPFDNG